MRCHLKGYYCMQVTAVGSSHLQLAWYCQTIVFKGQIISSLCRKGFYKKKAQENKGRGQLQSLLVLGGSGKALTLLAVQPTPTGAERGGADGDLHAYFN